jgi:hypothetical protein
MKRIAILQSDYIPWKGYFDIIRSAEEIILLDNVQYTKRDWRNRNIIKTANGLKWLTIPVKVKGLFNQLICETETVNNRWTENHWETIKRNYDKSDFFNQYFVFFQETYSIVSKYNRLSEINRLFIDLIIAILQIKTTIRSSLEFAVQGKGSERILNICLEAGASEYITGPSGLNYLEKERFKDAGINIVVADYSFYPEYCQLYPPFDHNVSIIDLIFNTGTEAITYMRKF